MLSERFGIPHLATGDLFRRDIAEAIPVAIAAKAYVDASELVPDDLVTDLVINSLETEPQLAEYILDGFPRTLAQAQTAYGHLFTAVIMLEV